MKNKNLYNNKIQKNKFIAKVNNYNISKIKSLNFVI